MKGTIGIRFLMYDENESFLFNLNFKKKMQFSLQVRDARSQGHSKLKLLTAQPECLLRFTIRLTESVSAGEEHGLHTNDFTSAAQNLNQASKKPTSPPNTC